MFVGGITQSTVSGLDVGSLYEGSAGGEGVVLGGAVTQSFTTGKTSGFAFGGGSLSAGPLGGVQVDLSLALMSLDFISNPISGRAPAVLVSLSRVVRLTHREMSRI